MSIELDALKKSADLISKGADRRNLHIIVQAISYIEFIEAELSSLGNQLAAITAERDTANAKVRYYESAITCDIPVMISADVSAKQIYTEKVADVVRERDALKARIEKPYAYAGEFDINDIRDMRTVIYRELSGFKTERKQPNAIYPLYRGEKL